MLAFVPYLGFSLGVMLASAAALIQFHGVISVLPVWGVYLVGQLLESYVLTPLAGRRSRWAAPGMGDLCDSRVR